ncbi:hypothetical protein D3C83_137450 [compost metagenome]
MMFLMPGTSFTPRCTECDTTREATLATTLPAPAFFSAAAISRRIGSNWLLPG